VLLLGIIILVWRQNSIFLPISMFKAIGKTPMLMVIFEKKLKKTEHVKIGKGERPTKSTPYGTPNGGNSKPEMLNSPLRGKNSNFRMSNDRNRDWKL